jgi:hypothetical protein
MECWCGSFDRCELPWPDIYTLCFRINESHLLDLMMQTASIQDRLVGVTIVWTLPRKSNRFCRTTKGFPLTMIVSHGSGGPHMYERHV